MAVEDKQTGGCMCEAIRFEMTSPPRRSIVCYCASCRRAAGAISVAWLTFRADEITYTQGCPATFASSPGVLRTFCSQCGTSLTYTRDGREDEIDITTGAMDHPEAYPPEGLVFSSHHVPWDVPLDRPTLHE